MSVVRSLVAPKGKVIFQPGQSCPGFIVLSKGSIKVTLTGSSGREVVLYRVRPGEVCLQTLSCLINDQPYGAEGVAETEIAGQLVPASDFHKKLADDQVFRDGIMSSVATRFAEYQQLVEEIALTGFDARLANVLLRMVGPTGVVETTHAALATETASGRAYVTRKLAEFAKKGWVKQKDDGIEILNLRELEQVAACLR
ncbi:Crp/Fnr family transcriptional regulator [Rhodobacteraceae bacterium N5(2021)]|uniref:Crp/Fnr family transcriptional regulator n=1 Tax=Gymnodinialimonas phycosphaerae TaxID=2841589 RepID=A0A975TV31_9RHOB|nr:Crp/Fnr family transcriptional regulator [Gymnodinialimonas phycosphaerae]MBY4895189.1 Crp/Fnr family transcriptional regulator [Gymnodinialimonas phycosphaerae]